MSSHLRQLENDEIRLLILNGHGSSAKYSLVHVSLGTAPEFYALSYSWLDLSLFPESEALQQNYIQIDGCDVAIGSNLSAALHSWRDHVFSHIPLWVDSLCIDQSNILERGEQVLRIYSIYEKATLVTVWLGPDSHDSSLAFDFMINFSSKAQDAEWVRRIITEHTYSREWKAVDHILRRSWWKRVWIIQEMIAANEVLFVCGQRTATSHLVLAFFRALISRHATYWPLLVREEGIELYGDSITLGNIYLRQSRWNKRKLLQTIYATGNSLASDDRDKIYAVLGLAEDARKLVGAPDYSQTVEEVYKRFAISFVQEYGTLEFLSLAGLPAFPRKAGRSLPSWTPDWNHRKAATVNSTIRPSATTNAARGYAAKIEFSADLEKLSARGICIDAIDGMAYSVWGARNSLNRFEVQQTSSRTSKYQSDRGALEAISRILIGGCHPSGQELSVFMDKCQKSASMQLEDLKPVPTGDALFCEWYQHNRKFIIAGKSLEELVKIVQGESAAIEIDDTASERYTNRLSIHGRNRRLMTTTTGYLGMAVNSCLPGDFVCIIFGCSTPVLLRRVEDHYVFLGECYLYGAMRGEVIDQLEKGEFIEETFCIW